MKFFDLMMILEFKLLIHQSRSDSFSDDHFCAFLMAIHLIFANIFLSDILGAMQ